MTAPRRAVKGRIHPYLGVELRERLGAYCAKTSTTESAVVEAALREYLDGMSDRALVLRRLDRLGRGLARAQRDLELHAEAFAVFVKVWFAHTPSVPAEGRKAAQNAAEGRYRQFVEFVATQFAGGRRFVDDLPREAIGEEGDGAAEMGAERAAFSGGNSEGGAGD